MCEQCKVEIASQRKVEVASQREIQICIKCLRRELRTLETFAFVDIADNDCKDDNHKFVAIPTLINYKDTAEYKR